MEETSARNEICLWVAASIILFTSSMERDKSPERGPGLASLTKQFKNAISSATKDSEIPNIQRNIILPFIMKNPDVWFIDIKTTCSMNIEDNLSSIGWIVQLSRDGWYLLKERKVPERVIGDFDVPLMNDEELANSINASLNRKKYTLNRGLKNVDDSLQFGGKLTTYGEIPHALKKRIKQAGYQVVKIEMYDTHWSYRIIDKKQYDEVKARLKTQK
jgi:hypothetical protein